jgi:hypothetical protein
LGNNTSSIRLEIGCSDGLFEHGYERTHIHETSPNNVEKRKSSKDQTVVEKALDELESIQMVDEVKNVLVTIIN